MLVDFKDYYKFPLKPMPGLELIKVLTDDNQMAFDWCVELAPLLRHQLLTKINGIPASGDLKTLYIPEDGIVYYGKFFDKPLLRIRGWGHLTGIGGLHLSEDKAKEIQDAFGNYIVKQLNSH